MKPLALLLLAGCALSAAPHDTEREHGCVAIVDATANRALACGAYQDVAWAKLQVARERCRHVIAVSPLGDAPATCLESAEARPCDSPSWPFWCSAYIEGP